MSDKSHLVLGWQVTHKTLEPKYWIKGNPRPGSQSEDDLVRIPSEVMAGHSAIIAQSGGGKSFFIGRLIEEILLETHGRCLIIDPNGDFRRGYEVVSEDLWKKAAYDSKTRSGKLPHESSRQKFSRRWNTVPIRIRAGGEILRPKPEVTGHSIESLKVRWTALNVDVFAEDIGPLFRSNLFHCHEFVRTFEALSKLHKFDANMDLLSESEKLMCSCKEIDFEATVEAMFKEDTNARLEKSYQFQNPFLGIVDSFASIFQNFIRLPAAIRKELIASKKKQLISSAKYISEEVQRYYFAKAHEYEQSGILENSVRSTERNENLARLDVIDLPSLKDKSTQLLVVNAILETEWTRQRELWADTMKQLPEEDLRVPTFIVVDEAHNLIPADPPGRTEKAIRDQFRTIVAEGRKYGLFLILASQRPDKLDPMVFSECDNFAVMRLNSAPVVEETTKILGQDKLLQSYLERCREFDIGRVLLAGSWAPDGPCFMYTAARRTIEGGRNLRPDHWAKSWMPHLSSPEKRKGKPTAESKTKDQKVTKK